MGQSGREWVLGTQEELSADAGDEQDIGVDGADEHPLDRRGEPSAGKRDEQVHRDREEQAIGDAEDGRRKRSVPPAGKPRKTRNPAAVISAPVRFSGRFHQATRPARIQSKPSVDKRRDERRLDVQPAARPKERQRERGTAGAECPKPEQQGSGADGSR